ncbi:ribosome recycling factor [Sulfuriroseicoccus oceanibius]|uniref:Ribosome-recycling factor n=1 Tax=Sulfuriroseicoccus oceanibius TaxID=2707525 RepID=A0A6B3L4A1_9BACT|nr:ribosome recycling factor [Sulfuriroseicoccus oceanibius]QQL45308.1 ribosome recycling factor [Sulfuriroseicoccus oceanibius]
MTPDLVTKTADEAMSKSVEFMTQEFAGIRTGKASPGLVEGLNVEVQSYGSTMKLNGLATITTPDNRTINVSPFDPSTAADIERAIRESNLGINPSRDGKIIRLPIPELTGERRKELVKVIKGKAEEARVRVRSARRDAIDSAKKLEKDKAISEDERHDMEAEIQKITDKYVGEIDTIVGHKEEEILTV